MMTTEDLQAISDIIKSETVPLKGSLMTVEKRLKVIEHRLMNIEESLEETRSATNSLLDWADRVETVTGIRV